MIDAIYFDGQSTRRQPVTMLIHKRVVSMRGDGVRFSARLSRLGISERLENAPRIVQLPNGGFIEISDTAGFDRMLADNRYCEPRVVRWQQNWPLSLLALVSLLTALITGYHWGLPWAADQIARHLPASVEQKIGDAGLQMIDESYMQPTRLDVVDQARLKRLFAEMKQPYGETVSYRLEFRSSKIGPNAFALPNGVIVMTDELVQLAQDDSAVLGVLSHELGHVRHRHSMRRLLQALGVGVVVNLFIGDVSSALAAVPTFLLDQKYSRDFEREADQYAIDMMQANGLSLSPMAELFEKMRALHDEGDKAAAGQSPKSAKKGTDRNGEEKNDDHAALEYLSSHPSDAERIAKLRAADARK
jgi:Zn-dependent protease with chaperone function